MLNIPWVLRTDNDVFEKNNKETEYYAGLSRIMNYFKKLLKSDESIISYWEKNKKNIEWRSNSKIPEKAKKVHKHVSKKLESYGMFLSNEDLENDLVCSALHDSLMDYYEEKENEALVKKMQSHKAMNMMEYVNTRSEDLSVLADDQIMKPLKALIIKIENNNIANDENSDR
jgi:putative ATP-dependent endonuclease of OLD family